MMNGDWKKVLPKRLIPIAGWAALYLFAMFVVGWLVMTLLVRASPTMLCPDVTNMSLVEAIEKADDMGVRIKIDGVKINTALPPNTILSQVPPAGSLIKERAPVAVVVTAKGSEKRIPDVRGFPKEFALKALKDFGIEDVRMIDVDRGDVRDQVLSQDPPPVSLRSGISSGPESSAVVLLVSKGVKARRYIMPDLKGRNFEEVARSVSEQGIRIKGVRYVLSRQLAADAVLDHDPPAGFIVDASEGVTFTVNRKQPEAGENSEGSLLRFLPYKLRPGLFTKRVYFDPGIDVAGGRVFPTMLRTVASPADVIYFPVILERKAEGSFNPDEAYDPSASPKGVARELRYRVEEWVCDNC